MSREEITIKSFFDKTPLMRMRRWKTKQDFLVYATLMSGLAYLIFFTLPVELGGNNPPLRDRLIVLAGVLVAWGLAKTLVELIGGKRLAALRRQNPTDSVAYQEYLDSPESRRQVAWMSYLVLFAIVPQFLFIGS